MCLKYHSVAFRSAVEIISQQTLWGDLNRIKNCPISIYRFKHSRLCTRKHISPLFLSNQTESIDSRICSEPSRLSLQKQNKRGRKINHLPLRQQEECHQENKNHGYHGGQDEEGSTALGEEESSWFLVDHVLLSVL